MVLTRVSTPSPYASVQIGALGTYSLFVVSLLKPDTCISIGLARLAETSIQKVRGKQEGQSLGDKILSSSIGGALATWNQPIEVIRVEVLCFSTQFTFSPHRRL